MGARPTLWKAHESARIADFKAWLRSGELAVAVMLTALVFTFTSRTTLFTDHPPLLEHLGGEYYNIAVALAEGRGYSDPFGALSGPTAWMPPVFTYLLAGLVLALAKKASVAHAVVILTGISWVAVGVIVFRIARQWRTTVSPFLVVALYAGWLWAFYGWFFLITHDIWLVGLTVALVAASFSQYLTRKRMNPWTWGLVGGFATLTSPAVAFAWLGLSLFILFRAGPERRRTFGALALAAALGAPWVVRNAVVFHRLIPTKSNTFYEAYQANYQDDDGIYDGTYDGALLNHPYNSIMMRHEYVERGELGFVDEHRNMFLGSLTRDPGRYARAVVHRLFAVTVNYVPFNDMAEKPLKAAVQRCAYALPFLMLLVLFSLRRPAPPLVTGMAVFYGLYLVPYVLIAFYPRYVLPLTPILVISTFLAIDRIASMALKQPLRPAEGYR